MHINLTQIILRRKGDIIHLGGGGGGCHDQGGAQGYLITVTAY